MLKLILKYKPFILYMVFGGFTTLINIVTYWVCYQQCGLSNTLSNIIAWILSVLFAFITNKLFVFESRTMAKKTVLFEAVSFFGCRGATGLLDLGTMYFCVDIMGWMALPMKVLSNIIVILLNYLASKLFIFKKAVPKTD